METPNFVVLPVNVLAQFRSHCATIEEARALATSLATSGHESALILQPLSVIERVKDVTERTLFTLAHDVAGALLDEFISDGGVSSLSGAQLSLVADAQPSVATAEDYSLPTMAEQWAAAVAAQADGHAEQAPTCGHVAEDGRVCVAMPHDEGGHLLQPPTTDVTRQVVASGQP